jgi:methenyltetrahydromethanopterin cyclohydrolase
VIRPVGEMTTVLGESRDGDVAEVKRYFAAGSGQARALLSTSGG